MNGNDATARAQQSPTMNRLLKSARRTITWFMPGPLQKGILKRILRRRGIVTEFAMTISRDIVGEYPVNLDRVDIAKNVKIGKHTYFSQGVVWSNVVIGRYCSLSYNVLIAAHQHDMDHLSTHPMFSRRVLGGTREEDDAEKMTLIGNDVWIGGNVVIRRGVTIGDGAVVGAGSVVLEDVPPYSIVAGVPSRFIRYRFSEDIIRRLLELRWWECDEEILKQLPMHDVGKCIDILERHRVR